MNQTMKYLLRMTQHSKGVMLQIPTITNIFTSFLTLTSFSDS